MKLNHFWDWAKVAGICSELKEMTGLLPDDYDVLEALSQITAEQAKKLADAMKED